MNIAIFTETFVPMTDGIVTRLKHTIDILLDEGHRVVVFAPDRGLARYKSAVIVGLKGTPLVVYPEKQISFPSLRIGNILRRFRPDLIHAVNPINIGAFGVYYAKKYGLPLISSYHTNVATYTRYYRMGFLEPLAWSVIRFLHNQSHLNLATSTSMVQLLRQQGIRRVYLWERGVDRRQFGPAYANLAMRCRLSDGKPERLIFLYVGRLGPEKQLERLRPLLDLGPDVCLAFVGDGPARPKLEKVFHGTATTFLGPLHGRALAEAYASSDVFVFPSTSETLGLVLMEAMASGLPIVAADSSPTRELLLDDQHGQDAGLLFDPDDPQQLLSAARTLLERPALRRQLGAQAYRKAEDLDWQKPTRQLLRYYKKAMAIHRRHARQTR